MLAPASSRFSTCSRLCSSAAIASFVAAVIAATTNAALAATLSVGVDGATDALTLPGPVLGYEGIAVGTDGGSGTLNVLAGGIGPAQPPLPGAPPATIRVGTSGNTSTGPTTGMATVFGGIEAGNVYVGEGWNATGELSVEGDVTLSPPDADAASPYGTLYVGVNALGGASRGDVSIDGDVHANLIVGRIDRVPDVSSINPRSAIGNLAISGFVRGTSVAVGAAAGGETGPYDGAVTIGGDLILDHPSSAITIAQRPRRIGVPASVPPPDISGSVMVGGVTRFSGETPQAPPSPFDPPHTPRRLFVGISDAPGAVSGHFETEAIENADQILVGTNYRGFDGGGHRGELVVRSGGIANNAVYLPTTLTAGFRQRGGPGGIGRADITGNVELGGIYAQNEGTEVILRNGESSTTTVQIEPPPSAGTPAPTSGARLELDRFLLHTSGVVVAEGGTLALRVDGPERGTEYAAVQGLRSRGGVSISGTLEVILADSLPAGIYDLIVARSIGGFTDLDELIHVVGANPGRARFEHIVEPLTTRLDRHTLRMTIVPEPSTALLLGLGLASLARTRRHVGR